MASDPRIEAAAKALLNVVPWTPKWEAAAEEVRKLVRLDARRALAAADAADPLRDRDRMLPIIEGVLRDRWPLKAGAAWVPRLAAAVFDAIKEASDG